MERELYAYGYKTMLCNTLQESNREKDYIDMLKRHMADGIFSTDLIAAAFLNVAKRFGRKVPEDLQVIGYDGCLIPELTSPSLTTIVQPVEEIAKRIVYNMICLIGKRHEEVVTDELPVYIKEGGSTL